MTGRIFNGWLGGKDSNLDIQIRSLAWIIRDFGDRKASSAITEHVTHELSIELVRISNPFPLIEAFVEFPPTQIAIKLGLSVGIGLAVGLEREWAHKDVGVRTFAITALLGMLSALLGFGFAVAAFVGVFLLVAYVNIRSLVVNRTLEITTSVALMVMVLLGVLVGEGHWFTPVASAVVVTMLLAWKTELARFAGGLTPEEIRSAVFMGLIAFVIYPILPNYFIDPWKLVNPREIWIVIIILAGIGFANYVLLRLYGTRGFYYTALLGGLVNSTATVAELCPWLAAAGDGVTGLGVAVVLLTSIAMFARNLVIVAIFAVSAFTATLWPLGCMAAFAGVVAWLRHGRNTRPPMKLKLSSPMSLRRVVTFGGLFLIIEIAGKLAERYLGHVGFLIVSLLGGLVSSASTTATAAIMVAHGQLQPQVAGVAVVLCSVSSALVNLPLVYQQTRQKQLTGNLVAFSSVMVLLGLIVLAIRLRWGQ
ncbi:MAG: MgtC/SapB family protein [Terriglobia bacterium]